MSVLNNESNFTIKYTLTDLTHTWLHCPSATTNKRCL